MTMDARRSKAGPFAALVGSFAAGALTVALFGPHGGTGTPTAGPTVTAPAVTQGAVDTPTVDTPTTDAAEVKADAAELHSILVGVTGYLGYPEPGSLLAAVNGPLRAGIVSNSTPRWCTVPAVRQYTNGGLPKPLGAPTRERCGNGPSLAHVQALAAAVDAGVK